MLNLYNRSSPSEAFIESSLKYTWFLHKELPSFYIQYLPSKNRLWPLWPDRGTTVQTERVAEVVGATSVAAGRNAWMTDVLRSRCGVDATGAAGSERMSVESVLRNRKRSSTGRNTTVPRGVDVVMYCDHLTYNIRCQGGGVCVRIGWSQRPLDNASLHH